MANGAATAFDIFSLSEKFEKVGFPKDQIKVIIEAISASRSNPEAVSHADLRAHKTKVKATIEKVEANIEKHESKVLQAISELRKDTTQAIASMEARFDAKFEAQHKDNEISRKHAESLIDKAKFHLLSWMVALTLGPTVFRNLWQFLSMPGVSH